jgi:hypothetical protein
LNRLIAKLDRYSNPDPVTGQAAQCDLRVRIDNTSLSRAHEA